MSLETWAVPGLVLNWTLHVFNFKYTQSDVQHAVIRATEWFQTRHDSGCSEWRRYHVRLASAGRHLLLFGADWRETFLLFGALMSTVSGQESLSSLQVDSGVLSLNYFPVPIGAD